MHAMCAAEQSSSAGLLVADLLALGQGGVEVVFGCETKETGEIFNQEADGILGLGNSEVSLVNQVGGTCPVPLLHGNMWRSNAHVFTRQPVFNDTGVDIQAARCF